MKISIYAAFVGVWLIATPPLWAQNKAGLGVAPIRGPIGKMTKTGELAPKSAGKNIEFPALPRAKYRLHIWAQFTRTIPLDADNKSALYGTLTVNDAVRWSVPAEAANSFRHGLKEQIEISEDTAHLQGGPLDVVVFTSRPLAHIKLGISRPPLDNSASWPHPRQREVLGLFDETINLKNLVGQTHKISPLASLPIQAFVKVESLGAVTPPVNVLGSYAVTARLRVTKAADGPLDNQVELGGNFSINGQTFRVPDVSAKAGDEIALGSQIVALNKTNPKMLLIASIFDKKEGANTQPMLSIKTPLDLSRIVDENGNCVIPGQGQNVSADLLLHISKDKNSASKPFLRDQIR